MWDVIKGSRFHLKVGDELAVGLNPEQQILEEEDVIAFESSEQHCHRGAFCQHAACMVPCRKNKEARIILDLVRTN